MKVGNVSLTENGEVVITESDGRKYFHRIEPLTARIFCEIIKEIRHGLIDVEVINEKAERKKPAARKAPRRKKG